jgi:Fur family zinc uptake transcriptional regulator
MAATTQALERAEQRCRQQGLRLTARRRRVLEILYRSQRPLGAYEILERLGDGAPLAPPTVYRALDFLLEQGLIHKLETLHAFIGCEHPEQPHLSQFLICAQCGLVTEMADAALQRELQVAAARTGFEPRRPVVEVMGVCAGCLPEQTPATGVRVDES